MDDYSFYESLLQDVFDHNIQLVTKCNDEDDAEDIARITKQGWLETFLPICFLCFHNHRQMMPCEKHVRIAVHGEQQGLVIVDIPLWYWDKLCKNGATVKDDFVTFV